MGRLRALRRYVKRCNIHWMTICCVALAGCCLLSFCSIKALLVSAAFGVSTLMFIKSHFKASSSSGLLGSFPLCLQEILLRCSLYDIFCYLHYGEGSNPVYALLIAPFIRELPPERALEYLEEVSPSMRELILTKGIINVLPPPLQQSLKPCQINEADAIKGSCKGQDDVSTQCESTTALSFGEVSDSDGIDRIPLKSSSEYGIIPKIGEPKKQTLLSSVDFYQKKLKREIVNKFYLVKQWDHLEQFLLSRHSISDMHTIKQSSAFRFDTRNLPGLVFTLQ